MNEKKDERNGSCNIMIKIYCGTKERKKESKLEEEIMP